MKRIFTIILGLIILTLAGGAFAWKQGYLPENIASKIPTSFTEIPWPTNITSSIKAPELDTIVQDTSSQLSVLSSKAGEIGGHAKNILGDSIQVSEEEKPIHEKAIEYGQYVYCQQVVSEYEARETN